MNEQNITVKLSGHDIYKAVSNYLTNNQGVSKQYIEEQIEQRVEKIVARQIEQHFKTDTFIFIIKNAIVEYLEKGVPLTSSYSYTTQRQRFDTWIQGQLQKIIQEEVLSKYTITVAPDSKKLIVEKNNE